MPRVSLAIWLACVLFAGGCSPDGIKTSLVSDNPFGQVPQMQGENWSKQSAATLEVAARVDSTGRKLVAANSLTGMRPQFRTLGAPEPEIFHEGTSQVVITEGLVKRCATEGQLAAVLAQELGKMVAERETLAGPSLLQADRDPPMDVPVGSDRAGSFGPADQVHRAELAKFDNERQKLRASRPAPDPQLLARTFLQKAGYAPTELDGVASILSAAGDNRKFARQMLNSPAPPPTK